MQFTRRCEQFTKRILVIGASGFLGKYVVRNLRTSGYHVRCLTRNTSRIEDLADSGCEIVQGDISNSESMQRALESVDAAYISIHTLSPQSSDTAGQGFMDVEMNGLRNIVSACKMHGVRRLIYVTFLGTAPDSPSAWVRERWRAEQFLINSGLDVTVIRPGQIVGQGGHGFDLMVSQARKFATITFSNGYTKMRNIAIDDLVYYLVGVLNESRTYGKCYDVGCDDVLTNNEMLDMTAKILGRRPPIKIAAPLSLLYPLAPLIENISKLPKGSLKGMLDGLKIDLIGDPIPIRTILNRSPLSYRQAVEKALLGTLFSQ